MNRLPKQNRAWVLATAKAVAKALKLRCAGTRLRVRIPRAATSTDTDEWSVIFGDLGRGQPRLEVWFDRFAGYPKRKLFACFRSEVRHTLVAVTKRVDRKLWPVRVVTSDDFDEDNFVVLKQRAAAGGSVPVSNPMGLALYATASDQELRESLSRRDTPWYADSIVPLLRGLLEGCDPGPFFLSGLNGSQTIACGADDILEMRCVVENHTIARIPMASSPPTDIARLISQFCHHEKLATDAVLARDVPLLEKALSVHPWIESARATLPALPRVLAEWIVMGNAQMLSA